MNEPNAGCVSSRGDVATLSTAEASRPRKPFVRPAVQDLGGLTTLTLLGGSL
jgi:hypothetical protein